MMKSVILSAVLAGQVAAFAFLPTSRAPGFRNPSAWRLNSIAERVLEAPKFPPEWPYTANDFARMDESNDSIFYDNPRLVGEWFCWQSLWLFLFSSKFAQNLGLSY